MKSASRRLACGLIASAALAVQASAHHSMSMYDRAGNLSISGTVKEFEWTNPHAWIHLVVTKADGSTEAWNLEGAGVGRLERSGWNKEMMHEGDKVTVKYGPRRDGMPGGVFHAVTTPDGKTYVSNFGPPGYFSR